MRTPLPAPLFWLMSPHPAFMMASQPSPALPHTREIDSIQFISQILFYSFFSALCSSSACSYLSLPSSFVHDLIVHPLLTMEHCQADQRSPSISSTTAISPLKVVVDSCACVMSLSTNVLDLFNPTDHSMLAKVSSALLNPHSLR